jgi:8-oxo-dGTP diphosphatase
MQSDFFTWLATNPTAAYVVVALISIVVTTAIIVSIVAFKQGREIGFSFLKIGPKPEKDDSKTSEKTAAQPTQKAGKRLDHELFLKRQDIHWPMYNEGVSHKYWACGTSLVGVIERGLIQNYFSKGLKDIKLILPNTDKSYASYDQLDAYNKFGHGYDQVNLAKESFEKCRRSIPGGIDHIDDHLRIYGGVMYSNITIFDDRAFIAFYNSTGIGDTNVTLCFNRGDNEQGYHLVEEEFLRMWQKCDCSFGKRIEKKEGVSMILLNPGNKVVMYRRDNKNTIPFANCLDLLGGHVEKGETPTEAIVREIREEIEFELDSPVLFDVSDEGDRIEYTFWQRANIDITKLILHEGQKPYELTFNQIKSKKDEEIAFGFRKTLLKFFSQRPFD